MRTAKRTRRQGKRRKATKRSTTGRFLVFYPQRSAARAERALQNEGFRTLRPTRQETLTLKDADLRDVDVLFHPVMGCAVVSGEGDHLARLRQVTGPTGPLLDVREERIHQVKMPRLQAAVMQAVGGPLDRTGVSTSRFDGSGIRVAVLDTGIDLEHPDLQNGGGLPSRAASFVDGDPSVEDVAGHGTHVAGIIAGAEQPHGIPRFSVAPGAELFVGRVVSGAGSVADDWIVRAIEWAILKGCRIACLAVNREVVDGEPYDGNFELFVQAALRSNCLVVSAIGNHSRRSKGKFRPVGHPANCPSMLSVSAIGEQDVIFDWANRNAGYHGAGEVDVVAPGVLIQATRPGPARYGTRSGTSQAAAHVSGAAALVAQSQPGLSAYQVGLVLKETATMTDGWSPLDVGTGCIRVPQ